MKEVTATVGVHFVDFRGGDWKQRVETASRFQSLLRDACLDTYPVCFEQPLKYPEEVKKRGALSVLYIDEWSRDGLPRGVTTEDIVAMAAKAVYDDGTYGVAKRRCDVSGVRAELCYTTMGFIGGSMEARICAAVTFQEMLREEHHGVYQIYEPAGRRVTFPKRDYNLSVALNTEWRFFDRNEDFVFSPSTLKWLSSLGMTRRFPR